MAEGKYKIILEGDDRDAIQKIEKTVKKINEAKDATARWDRQRAAMAQKERQDKFRSLSIDQQREKLTQRQIVLERRLAQATAQGNAMRVSALRLSMARNASTLSGIGGGGGAATGGATSGGLSALAERFLPAVSAAYVGKKIFNAITSAVHSALSFADNMSDLSEQTGLSVKQIVKLQQAAGYAGVSGNKVIESLSHLSNLRSAALGGDQTAQAVFKRFGISGKSLESQDPLSIALAVQKSLGSAGPLATDAGPLQMLFGRSPRKTLAALNNFDSAGDIGASAEGSIGRLDKINSKVESTMNVLQLLKVKLVDKALSFLTSETSTVGQFIRGGIGANSEGSFFNNLLKDSSGSVGNAARTADPGAFVKAAAKKRVNGFPEIGPIASTMQADSLARMGFGSGRDPEGIGLVRKQIEWQEKLYRTANEQKQILQEGLLQ